MPSKRDKKHILIRTSPRAQTYKRPPMKIEGKKYPVPEDRVSHGSELKTKFNNSQEEARSQKQQASAQVDGVTPGFNIQFVSPPGVPLELESLQAEHRGIFLQSVTYEETIDSQIIQKATIFVPEGKISHFLDRFDAYCKPTPPRKGEKRYYNMIDRIADIRLATLKALWTELSPFPSANESITWEFWLRRHDGNEVERLKEYAAHKNITIGAQRIAFDDRIVILVTATPWQLSDSINVLNDIAELRKAKDATKFFEELSSVEQQEWAEEMQNRIRYETERNTSVCILDTGVNSANPLLEGHISQNQLHTIDPTWGENDHDGHGTGMAGLVAYGDLEAVLQSHLQVHIKHQIESVKILPPQGDNDPQLYGAICVDAVAQVETSQPDLKRCFNLAVTASNDGEPGEPSSWSAVIDALSVGRELDPSTGDLAYLDDGVTNPRLFLISAGNIRESFQVDHLSLSDTMPIESPAQAWNCVAVGAFTDKAQVQTQGVQGWNPVARPGELSPFSRTSLLFSKSWPIKPDVVFEGGNLIHNTSNNFLELPELSVLTTYYKPLERTFGLTNATSSACAKAANLSAKLMSEYPEYWPETIRGLMIHSAEWTRTMIAHFNGQSLTAKEQLVRRYGYGVPSENRALRSGSDALTLVSQAIIKPFLDGKMNEMHTHDLPWPAEILEELGNIPVKMRVTLSYFIEPNPGRRGWTKRYRYASHGLRFEVKGATESVEKFEKRLNANALAEGESRPRKESDPGWFLGSKTRSKGSIHSDTWTGTAADLASRGCIGVYPVSGWWKDLKKKDRSHLGCRYALIISIETEDVDVDIWTPVAQKVGIPIKVEEN